ncbi:hypothetical protein [Streptomyces omiyaensis]|uniref:hypothetical protein n=1 Tax=Streptomyces omiyaensis TaxID=68247 RepID=UPI0036FD921C
MAQPNTTVQQLQAEAAKDYQQHNDPHTAAARRLQQGLTIARAQEAAGSAAARAHCPPSPSRGRPPRTRRQPTPASPAESRP